MLRQQQQDQQRIEFHNNDNVHNEPILPSPQLLVTSMSTSKSETDAIESPSSPASNCTASVNPGSSITTRRRQSTSRTTSTSSPRPSYQRFDSNESTPAFASTPGSGSIAVSRSPPLGQLIKRVIFTPPDHSDDHKPALYVAATPDRPGEPSQLGEFHFQSIFFFSFVIPLSCVLFAITGHIFCVYATRLRARPREMDPHHFIVTWLNCPL